MKDELLAKDVKIEKGWLALKEEGEGLNRD